MYIFFCVFSIPIIIFILISLNALLLLPLLSYVYFLLWWCFLFIILLFLSAMPSSVRTKLTPLFLYNKRSGFFDCALTSPFGIPDWIHTVDAETRLHCSSYLPKCIHAGRATLFFTLYFTLIRVCSFCLYFLLTPYLACLSLVLSLASFIHVLLFLLLFYSIFFFFFLRLTFYHIFIYFFMSPYLYLFSFLFFFILRIYVLSVFFMPFGHIFKSNS